MPLAFVPGRLPGCLAFLLQAACGLQLLLAVPLNECQTGATHTHSQVRYRVFRLLRLELLSSAVP